MKALSLALFTLLITMTLTVNAQAGQKQVKGMLIGAGSGAILGQAIGHNTKSTMVGTVVGGVLGYAIGNEATHHNRSIVSHKRYQPDTYQTKKVTVVRTGKPSQEHYAYNRPRKVCRDTVAVSRFHGRLERRTITTCWTDRSHQTRRQGLRRDWR